MSYSSEVYKSAVEEISRRKEMAELTQDEHRNSFYAKCPKAEELEREISSTLIKAVKLVTSHNHNSKEVMEEIKAVNQRKQQELAFLLKENGFPEDYLEIHYHCNECRDTGYNDGRMCSCLKNQLRTEACRQLNRSTPLGLCTFEDFDLNYYSREKINGTSQYQVMERIFKFCKNYGENFSQDSKSLLLQGATGLGKTHLSLAIANTVIRKGYGVVYDSVHNIVSKLERERFGKNEDADTEDFLQKCDLLILDDLGTEFRTQFTVAAIYNIVNNRLMSGRQTIISTNLKTSQLGEYYSDRFTSRVLTSYSRLNFTGTDIRVAKRREKADKS